MNISEILTRVDHTLLSQTATFDQIQNLCYDAIKYGTASVCIPASFVKRAKKYTNGNVPICTVIGFPNGYSTTEAKVFEAQDAIKNGADEIDMVINLGYIKEKLFNQQLIEIEKIKEVCGEKILKVIVETCLLTKDEKIKMCEIVTVSGADFIKTSTGFSKTGATFEDVELFSKHIGKNVKIKAAGGISTLEDAEKFISLGAERLGTSKIVAIAKNLSLT